MGHPEHEHCKATSSSSVPSFPPCRSLRRRRLSLEVGSHALSLLAVLGKESGVMSVAVNVGFAAVVAVRSSNGALAADAFPGALRKRRIIRDIIVVSLKYALQFSTQ